MTENEAIKFIGQAVIESGKALESLQSIKSEAERIGKVGEYYANLNNCIKEIEACRVAIIAIEEIQLYRATGTVEEFKALKEGGRFLEFLYNHIPPNEMEQYLSMYQAKDKVAVNGYADQCGLMPAT